MFFINLKGVTGIFSMIVKLCAIKIVNVMNACAIFYDRKNLSSSLCILLSNYDILKVILSLEYFELTAALFQVGIESWNVEKKSRSSEVNEPRR